MLLLDLPPELFARVVDAFVEKVGVREAFVYRRVCSKLSSISRTSGKANIAGSFASDILNNLIKFQPSKAFEPTTDARTGHAGLREIRQRTQFFRLFGSEVLQARLRVAHGLSTPLLPWISCTVDELLREGGTNSEDVRGQYTRDICDSVMANLDKTFGLYAFISLASSPHAIQPRNQARQSMPDYTALHFQNHRGTLFHAAAAAVGSLDIFIKTSEAEEHEQRMCRPFKSTLCAAVATGKLNVIEHILHTMQHRLDAVESEVTVVNSEVTEVAALDIAHSIGVACPVAIHSQQRAAATALFEFLSRNTSLHFDLQRRFDGWFELCVEKVDTGVFDALVRMRLCTDVKLSTKHVSYVLEKGTSSALRLLLEIGEMCSTHCSGRESSKSTPLMMALNYQRLDLCEVLLANGAHIDGTPDDEFGVTALWHAANKRDVNRVQILLKLGANPESHDGWRSPLLVAKERGNQDVLDLLTSKT
jgi:hypothetical protein